MTNRSGTEQRQRDKIVSVRVDDVELAALIRRAARRGEPLSTMLRNLGLQDAT